MNYYSGGHLSHGYRHNVSSRMFQVETYDVDRDSKLLDYDVIRKQAIDFKPLILLAGYSAYSRLVNFKIMKEIADEVGAILMVDMAHFSGLVAGKTLTGEYNPIEYADVVTSTTHKTLRGPRGGMILCKAEFADFVNKGCPLVIGGPLPHVMAAKAVAFSEANTKSFQIYTQSIVDNAKTFANACIENGLEVLTGGTDNHLLLIDVSKLGLTGRQAEKSIRDVGITINRNSLPFDTNGAWYTSGLRVGTPAISTLGMGGNEMKEIASVFGKILTNTKSDTIKKGRNAGAISRANYTIAESVINESKNRVSNLLDKFPVYPELDLAFMKRLFC
jgi:glycine hydroxymethyltransferase